METNPCIDCGVLVPETSTRDQHAPTCPGWEETAADRLTAAARNILAVLEDGGGFTPEHDDPDDPDAEPFAAMRRLREALDAQDKEADRG